MLDGEKLVAALAAAMALKKDKDPRFGPSELGRLLGIKQPSASELLKTGRLKKDRYLKLVEAFSDVVGPEHWGLPYNSEDFEALRLFQKLPPDARAKLTERMRQVVAQIDEASSLLDVAVVPEDASRKQLSAGKR